MRHSKGWTRQNNKLALKQQLLTREVMICSLDLAKKKHAFHVLDCDQHALARGHVPHTRDGFERLLATLEELRRAKGFARMVFFMEGASHFWMTIVSLLDRKGYEYRLVLNRAVGHQRHVSGESGHKNDPIDAQLIGTLATSLRFSFSQLPRQADWIGLRACACEYQELIDLITAEKNRIHAFLETVLPDYYQTFADPFTATSLAVLRSLTDSSVLEDQQFVDAVRHAFEGRNLQVQRCLAIWQYLRAGDPWGYVEARPALLQRLATAAARLQLLLRQRNAERERLLTVYARIPYASNLNSILGSSAVGNAVLLGLLGDPKAFDDSAAVVRMAGLDPGECSSGEYVGRSHITKVGRSRLRRAAVSATLAVLKSGKNPQFVRRFFSLQQRERRPLKALQALCACAGKYLRTLWWLCVHDCSYNTDIAMSGFVDKKPQTLVTPEEELVIDLAN